MEPGPHPRFLELLQEHDSPSHHCVVVDMDLTLRAVSEGTAETFGLTLDDYIGSSALELLHPDDLDRAAAVIAELVSQPGARPPGMYRIKSATDYRAVDISAVHELPRSPDEPGAIVYTVVELDDRRRAEALAREQVEVLELLMAPTEDGIARPLREVLAALVRLGERHIDRSVIGVTVIGDGRATRLDRSELPDLAGPAERPATALPPHVVGSIDRRLSTFEPIWDGDEFESVVTTPMFSASGEPIGYVEAWRKTREIPDNGEWSVHDLLSRLAATFLERARLDRELSHAALHDPLTGLANRRRLNEELEEICATGDPFALAVVDLDDFSWINNTYGHQTGDAVLLDCARRLESVVGERALVARPGGDEFVVLVPGVETAAALESLGDRLNRVMSLPSEPLGGRRHLRASIGLVAGAENDDPDRALASADAAMYVAKRAGGDGCHIPVGVVGRDQRRRYDMIRGLADAIDHGDLHLVFQPLVDVQERRWIDVEALVRWEVDGRTVAQPDEFVALAEQSDLILSLDEWVIATAGAQMRQWRSVGMLPSDGVVWVNVSPRTIERADFVDLVTSAAGTDDIDGLGIEVTERAVDTDPRLVAEVLTQVRAAGIPVALDDFGTGVASLQQLAELPATDLKIDGSFVAQMLESETYLTLVETILGMADRLNMRVTAEAIETEAQLERLVDLGCHQGQGYLIAPPLTAAEIEVWYRESPYLQCRRAPLSTPSPTTID